MVEPESGQGGEQGEQGGVQANKGKESGPLGRQNDTDT